MLLRPSANALSPVSADAVMGGDLRERLTDEHRDGLRAPSASVFWPAYVSRRVSQKLLRGRVALLLCAAGSVLVCEAGRELGDSLHVAFRDRHLDAHLADGIHAPCA